MASAPLGSSLDLVSLGKLISAWFDSQGRVFPWTQTRDPYSIWISEIMLQQTVVTAALDHYVKWIGRWPNLRALAQADDDQVLRQWEGLGYYSRARNLLKAARILYSQGAANLPLQYQVLINLPGMGDYTASAVLSFSANAPLLTIDGNLKRVFQRLFAQVQWTKDFEKTLKSDFQRVFELIPSRQVNQGLMQLGQLICRPSQPQCNQCPLTSSCLAHSQGLTSEIPAKKARIVTELRSKVLVILKEDKIFLVRKAKGLMKGLWTFPRFALGDEPSFPPSSIGQLKTVIHSYTRFREELIPLVCRGLEIHDLDTAEWDSGWFSWEEARHMAMPSVYRKIFKEAEKGFLA